MFTESISKQTAENLALLGKSKMLGDAYLAGGTALALQIGHRISYDLDFFTSQKFKAQIFLKEMSGFKLYRHERVAWGTILGRLGKVKFSLFYYPYPLLKKTISFQNINIASITDIAAMKIAAISERGTKRDFIDLYFILQKITLARAFNFYDRKYQKLSSNLVHIKKSLVYFDDAENDPMPKMIIPISWGKVKFFFEGEIKRFSS
ncbi:MAG: hypothetical protein A2654_00780 [Candidatus Nealsonbacteria bacterium RIFCSPHIGHO2_01_FULL_43_31]|uniref:Nucleotidyl transferase AbiEii/AbiGii toxin family protein n=2 Tax=Candidatus Nealsoniibacteriota TaxID=1817911 RepID=A0A1G2E8J4_9BACT|nr:MAG: hypothetical protein UV98_C0020G0007 [Parcubacteria group bacterium GW2011_GWB1_43_6]OGZ19899.1 MAG: hypothetical protein A2654_00780 [Candidatus Nealsonbacteria bacterium RIFCSPHIGHO2_01_FULL_43_31]OGZ21620.1 MAG: hypothetical protein A3D46_01155 [Candidatus Nealsonbacteria bacterium RIFCSPHIGHO2_02_FULL_43_13]OGZ25176.1 MAG: hypothetical protein A2922_00435 [Candidatus Nealsonbacteria bacterium RIFCSPLOWO2_01_FULL_43_36]